MSVLLGLDYGSMTVGVAATDACAMTVQPVETITRKRENHLRSTLARIEQIVAERNINALVLGCPLNMDGTEGKRVQKTREFGRMLQMRTGLPVYLCDERLTTVEADSILAECGVSPKNRKKYIDQVAAQLILEDFLFRCKGEAAEEMRLMESEPDSEPGGEDSL